MQAKIAHQVERARKFRCPVFPRRDSDIRVVIKSPAEGFALGIRVASNSGGL